jgi:hypothetical protein
VSGRLVATELQALKALFADAGLSLDLELRRAR